MTLQNTGRMRIENDGPRSQASKAYEAIRADILSGRLVPERKLKIQELSIELEVSPGAVREALSRLVPEQLVVSRDQRGFVVAPLSIPDLNDLTELRCEIEAIALRKSVELGDVDWEANVLAAEHRLRGINATLSAEELKRVWTINHAVFHAALVSACGSRRLLALHQQLYEQSERYRGLMFHVDLETKRDVQAEHREIVEYALARDSERLIGAMDRHLRTTTAFILQEFGTNSAT